ncbi:cobyrinate a,c-diamide synthase [Natranaerobius thermophilus]|uniref:cobyrinate a,c-diamide synthase n=1 Tax=Natranaerobius thermophilus TaxID=375929 RepID=UPI000166A8F6|nr:cobyrinate a,c-diamide synthase [Natranaerobius thermophilus]
MNRKRIVVAGTNSGSGKTTVTMALLAALRNQGQSVQGFKVGPDYIDPSFHTTITGRPARNLDTWMMSPNIMKEIFQRGSEKADISIIEGVMGLYDGKSGKDDRASTAEIAKKLDAPVILVVNAKSQARSVAALIYGFQNFDPDVKVAGVILNKVSSENHYRYLKEAVTSLGSVELLGYLPDEPDIELPERHLGLTPAEESHDLHQKVSKLADMFSERVDMKKINQLATAYEQWQPVSETFYNNKLDSVKEHMITNKTTKIPVAIAKDLAFSFYYQDNLEWLEEQGVEWVPVSPLKDKEIPEYVCGLYLGGGFPELYASQLSSNTSFMDNLKNLHKKGLPILAECGGFIYLCNTLQDLKGDKYSLTGLIPGQVTMNSRLMALGYREAHAVKDSILLKQGDKVKGHEFRYSQFEVEMNEELDEDSFPYAYIISARNKSKQAGYLSGNLLASYLHIHLASNINAAKRLFNSFHDYYRLKQFQ